MMTPTTFLPSSFMGVSSLHLGVQVPPSLSMSLEVPEPFYHQEYSELFQHAHLLQVSNPASYAERLLGQGGAVCLVSGDDPGPRGGENSSVVERILQAIRRGEWPQAFRLLRKVDNPTSLDKIKKGLETDPPKKSRELSTILKLLKAKAPQFDENEEEEYPVKGESVVNFVLDHLQDYKDDKSWSKARGLLKKGLLGLIEGNLASAHLYLGAPFVELGRPEPDLWPEHILRVEDASHHDYQIPSDILSEMVEAVFEPKLLTNLVQALGVQDIFVALVKSDQASASTLFHRLLEVHSKEVEKAYGREELWLSRKITKRGMTLAAPRAGDPAWLIKAKSGVFLAALKGQNDAYFVEIIDHTAASLSVFEALLDSDSLLRIHDWIESMHSVLMESFELPDEADAFQEGQLMKSPKEKIAFIQRVYSKDGSTRDADDDTPPPSPLGPRAPLEPRDLEDIAWLLDMIGKRNPKK